MNGAGGRGPEWPDQKPAGTIRILAIGESSTFGVASPEDRTWPAQLEQALAANGMKAGVLNFGIPGVTLERMITRLPTILNRYRPDAVLHYAGFNETWHEIKAPRGLWHFLNYRSMLYTYIYEKAYFRAEAAAAGMTVDTQTYERNFERLATLVREHHARLVIIEQATRGGAAPLEQSRAAWTAALQHVLAEIGARERLSVIDPRALLANPALFCDEVHLTDDGNRVLADAIAPTLSRHLTDQQQ